MSGFCRWYGKDMEDVTEHEQEQEAAGHGRDNTNP